jgi:poly(3-hydroxybutyrate) depolymerase
MKASCGMPPGGVPDMIGLSVVSVVAHGGSLPARGGHIAARVFHPPLVRHKTSPLVVSMHGGSILGTNELSWKFPLP